MQSGVGDRPSGVGGEGHIAEKPLDQADPARCISCAMRAIVTEQNSVSGTILAFNGCEPRPLPYRMRQSGVDLGGPRYINRRNQQKDQWNPDQREFQQCTTSLGSSHLRQSLICTTRVNVHRPRGPAFSPGMGTSGTVV